MLGSKMFDILADSFVQKSHAGFVLGRRSLNEYMLCSNVVSNYVVRSSSG